MANYFPIRLIAGLLFASIVVSGDLTSANASLNMESEAPVAYDGIAFDEHLLAEMADRGRASYLIYFADKADLSAAYDMDWEARGWYVYRALTETAAKSQHVVRSYLDQQGVSYKAFWIDNVIAVKGSDSRTLLGLRSFREIRSIILSPDVHLIEPIEARDAPSNTIRAIEPNISRVKAPDVWAMGITGEGITVATIDSGVRYTHSALVAQYRGNLGLGNFDHNYHWWDPDVGTTQPSDHDDHGSHVTGAILGDDGGANQIGMAPGANWIACTSFNSANTDAELLECGQFMLAPWDLTGQNANPSFRPHIVNNSWGACGNPTTYDGWYQGTVDAWLAAGIYPVFANGNRRVLCPVQLGSVGNPARYGNVTGVGALGRDDGVWADYSLLGASDVEDTINPRGYPFQKPQVSAPGTNRSAGKNSDTHYREMDGTSMAAPHVSGLIALVWEAAPCLIGNYATTETIIEETAVPANVGSYPGHANDGPGGVPNQATGWGEIDALAAVQTAQGICSSAGTIEGSVTNAETNAFLEGVTVTLDSGAAISQSVTTDAAGEFSISAIPEGSYAMTASAPGFLTQAISDVDVFAETVTVQNFALEPAPPRTISGVVTDATTGWPLYASITIDGDSLPTFWTNPVDGSYSISLPEGGTYTLIVDAWVTGFNTSVRDVGPLTTNTIEDFGLDANVLTCSAPGYGFAGGFSESFSSGTLPAGWTVIDNNGNGNDWRFNNPGNRTNLTGGEGGFAIVDSDFYGAGNSQDTELWTPSLDMTGETSVNLEFKYDFRWFANGVANVDVSIDEGANWTNVWSRSGANDRGPATAIVDISTIAAGEPDVIVRFHYLDAVYDWWWQVDDVKIGDPVCTPQAGGLLVGQVYDANTSIALTGAMVTGEVDSMVTVATATDPNLDDGFYTLFVPEGSSEINVSMAGGYADLAETIVIADGTTTDLDFYLEAGSLMATPPAIEMTLQFGSTASTPLTLTNNGNISTAYALSVERLAEDFETSFPPAGWTVVNNGGSCVWQRNDALSRSNYAGGDGFSAAADSDRCGSGRTINSELQSPILDLTGATRASLEFVASYHHFGSSSFSVHVSDDGGGSWDTLLTWTASSSAQGPGTAVSLDLTSYVGSSEVMVSFHYIAGWDWWAQVDQVRIVSDAGPWLSVAPTSGSVGGGAEAAIDLNFDTSSLLQPGIYQATIYVSDDTPYLVPDIPVTMTVTPTSDLALLEGTVLSNGYCDINPFAAVGAEVVITSGSESWSTITDENGFYSLYINQDFSPVQVEASLPDHESATEMGVTLVGEQTTVVDFDLRLIEPCATISPNELDTQVPADTVVSYTLDLLNSGAADLIWSIHEAETAAATERLAAPMTATENADNSRFTADLISSVGDYLAFVSGSVAVTGMTVDCDAEPGILITDDGSIENGYSANPATVSRVIFVDRFTPEVYPAIFSAVCVAFVSQGPDTLDFEIVLYAPDGPGGQPGTLLGSIPATAADLPDPGATPVWHSYDISSLDISIGSGDVYVGVTFVPSNPNVFIGADQSTVNPVGYGGGYWWNSGEGAWATVQSAYPQYRSLMIRPVQDISGCISPTDLPWVSVSPDNGTTGADSSDQIDISIDTTGLTTGETYTGILCFNSNDPIRGRIEIPLSVTPFINTPPVANAGPNQSVFVAALVQLDGTGSTDPEGQPLTYDWQQTGGPAVTLSDPESGTPTFTAPNLPATLTFDLTVTDPYAAFDSDQVVITVGDEPITGLQADNSSPTTLGQNTIFSASVTAGSNVIYDWDFGDGSQAADAGTAPTHNYAEAGVFTASVTARNDTNELTTTTIVSVTNEQPLADAGPDQVVDAGEMVTLDGSASSDPDGHLPLTYQWSQLTGETVVLDDATAVMPSFSAPLDVEPLVFELVVSDSFGLASDPDTVTITATLPEFEVMASLGSGQGSITPLTQTVTWGDDANFTVTPQDGWSTTTVTGDTCIPVQGDGEAWLAEDITEDCAVTANFAINVYTVAASVNIGQGSIQPPSQTVDHGESVSFTVEPSAGWSIDTVSGDTCDPESAGGDQWLAEDITEDCTVEVNFVINQYAIGGEVSGLIGTGLSLDLNEVETLAIDGDGPFTFILELDHDSDYAVTVAAQPSNPVQTCQVVSGDGTVDADNVTNIEISCQTDSFTIGGTVSGLEGEGLMLQNNGGDDLTILADGDFSFPTALLDLSAFEVTIIAQPTGPIQTCSVANGSNTLAGENVTDVMIECVNEPPAVNLSANALEFGVLFEGNSSTASVALSNTGTGDLVISDLVAPGEPFTLIGGTCTALPVTLLPGESCDIEIAFMPLESFGDYTEGLTIISNATSSPDTISLSGGVRQQPIPIPALGTFSLLLLMLLIAGFAWRFGRMVAS